MSDLINRQDAIDALRYAQHRFTVADESGGMGTVKWSEEVIYFAAAERALNDLPSVQPEIIYCKDCENWKAQVKDTKGDGLGCCTFHKANFVTGEGYCYWAERRIDDLSVEN